MVVELTATVQGSEPPRVQIVATGFVDPSPLITNGSFESGLTGWTAPGAVLWDGSQAAWAPDPADGASYLRKNLTVAGEQVVASQQLTAAAGSEIVASAQIAGTDGGGSITLRLTSTDGGVSTGVVVIDTVTAAEDWQSVNTSVLTLGPGDDGALLEILATPFATPMDVLVDAVHATTVGSTGTATLYREDLDGVRSVVRGAIGVTPTGGALVLVDHEAPFGVPVTYVLVQELAGALVETRSNPVTLAASLPWVTHPVTGQGVALTIETWPDLSYSARQSVVAVAGRAAPIVVSDVRLAAVSELTCITRTRDQLFALRELLATGDVLLVRPVCGAVETQFLAVGDVVESRIKATSRRHDPNPAGSDWRRRVSLSVQAVDQPAPQIPARGSTLLELHNYVPTTLADLADAFGPGATLLTIATFGYEDGVVAPPDPGGAFGAGPFGNGPFGGG